MAIRAIAHSEQCEFDLQQALVPAGLFAIQPGGPDRIGRHVALATCLDQLRPPRLNVGRREVAMPHTPIGQHGQPFAARSGPILSKSAMTDKKRIGTMDFSINLAPCRFTEKPVTVQMPNPRWPAHLFRSEIASATSMPRANASEAQIDTVARIFTFR